VDQEVLTVAGFLDPRTCREIRQAMDAGAAEPAEVLEDGVTVDESARRASQVEIDPAVRAMVEARLEAARARLEEFYLVPLGDREGPSLLRYGPGGFYGPHRDWGRVPEWPDAARRRIALVVFLNSSRDREPDGDFSGGALRLYAGEGHAAHDVHPRAGALVAFPATALHEVTVVHGGIRDTVVDWFYAR
jgi:predicted 2-oxoglutarate/Fe(II)-dependent dioxygenase YbiX